MFEIRCIVKDRALAEVMRALEPYALEPPVVQPSSEEKGKKNSHNFWGVANDIVASFASKPKGTKFTAKAVGDACEAKGLTRHAYSNAMTKAMKAKKIKRDAKPGIYEVL